MGWGQELKDFTKGFQSGYKMMEDSENSRVRNDYTKAVTDQIKGPVDAAHNAAVKGAIPLTYNQSDSAVAAMPPEQVKATIDKYVPEDMRGYAYKMAKGESNFDPSASRGTQGAAGLFQFIPSTWQSTMGGTIGRGHDPRLNPELNTQAFVKLTQANRDFLTKALGRAPTEGELAVAHQQGAQGALDLFKGTGKIAGTQAGNPKTWQDIERYYGFNSQPGAQKLADGGIVMYGTPDNPDVSKPQALPLSQGTPANVPLPPERPPELGGAQPQAIPTQGGAAPAPAPGGDSGGGLGEALHGALSFLSSTFGLGQQNAALPGTDSKLKDGQKRFAQGEGSVSPAEYNDVMKTVDPKGELPESARRVAALNAVYRYYLDRGDVDKANKAAASLVQTARLEAAKYGTVALQALKSGDQQGAIKAIQAGYDATPDGKDLQVDAATGTFKQVDSKSGQATGEGKITPEALIAAAEGLQNGSMYWEQVMAAAQQRDPAWQHRAERYSPQMGAAVQGIEPWVPKRIDGTTEEPTGGTPAGSGGAPQAIPATAPGAPDVSSEQVTQGVTPEADDSEGSGPDSGMGGGSDLRPQAIPTGTAQPGTAQGLPPIVPFEKLYGPRPDTGNPPPGLVNRPSELNAWRLQAEAQRGKVWDRMKADYDTKQAAARKEEIHRQDQYAIGDRANKSREFAANRTASAQEFSAKMAAQTQAFSEEQQNIRMKHQDEKDEVTRLQLPKLDPKDTEVIKGAVEESMDKVFQEFPDPANPGKPLGDAGAARQIMGPKVVRGVRDLAIKIAGWNPGMTADSAIDIAASIVSPRMTPSINEGPENARAEDRDAWMPSYSTRQDKAGNVMVRVGEHTVKVRPEVVPEIEALSTQLAKKLVTLQGEARKPSTWDKVKQDWSRGNDALSRADAKERAGKTGTSPFAEQERAARKSWTGAIPLE